MKSMIVWLLARSTPTGAMMDFAGTVAPSAAWLICDGSAVSRTTFQGLFAVIGTAYGVGDGSTTFNLPDCRGRVSVTYAGAGGHADVSTPGNSEGSVLANRRPKHNHTNSVTVTGAPGVGTLALPNHAHAVTDPGHTHTLNLDSVVKPGTTEVNASGPATVFDPASPTVNSATTGLTVGNPTSNPAITGAPSIGTLAAAGTIGPAGTNPVDAPAYVVVGTKLIKT